MAKGNIDNNLGGKDNNLVELISFRKQMMEVLALLEKSDEEIKSILGNYAFLNSKNIVVARKQIAEIIINLNNDINESIKSINDVLLELAEEDMSNECCDVLEEILFNESGEIERVIYEKDLESLRINLLKFIRQFEKEIPDKYIYKINNVLSFVNAEDFAYLSVVIDNLLELEQQDVSVPERDHVHSLLVSISDLVVDPNTKISVVKKELFNIVEKLGEKMSSKCRMSIDEAIRIISIEELKDPIHDLELSKKLPQDGVSVYLDAVGDFENMGLDSDTIKKLIDTGWTEYLPQAKGILQITDEHCEGHFPGNPIMPGIKMIEFANQTAIMFGYQIAEMKEYGEFDVVFAGMEGKTKYRRQAKPGDILKANVSIIEKSFKGDRGSVVFKAEIINQNDKVICTIDNFKGMVFKRKNQ